MVGRGASCGARRARARYVAIITDGNGRWAQQRGLPVIAGHEAGADTVKARLRDAARPRDRGADRVLVLDRELEPLARTRSSALMEMFAPPDRAGDARAHEEGVRMRFIGRRSAPGRRRADRADGVGRGGDARQHADHAVRGLQLRRPGGDRRCSANLYGRRRGRVPRPPVRP